MRLSKEEANSIVAARLEAMMAEHSRQWYAKRDKRVHRRWLKKERAESLGRRRALLSRQVGIRFGDEVSERFAALLEGINRFRRLDEIGELIVTCETGEELLARTNGGG